MKFKTTINLKKLISVFLCAILISSTIPNSLLNSTAFAENTTCSKCGNNDDAYVNDITINVNKKAIANVVNATTNYTLKKDSDYTISGNKIILKHEYLHTLDENTYELEISFDSDKETNPSEGVTLPKDTITLPMATFNNLKSKYTYDGDKPGKISLNSGSGSNKVAYSSSNTSVARINQQSGELTILGGGSFTVKATINNVTFESSTIKVDPVPLKMEMENDMQKVKIKNKIFDGKLSADFDGKIVLRNTVTNKIVKAGLTRFPQFSKIGPGTDIPINFDDVQISKAYASKYKLIKPTDIKANISNPTPPTINNPTLIKSDNNQPYNAGSWTNKAVTVDYTIKSGSALIDPSKTEISLDNGNKWINLSEAKKEEIYIDRSDYSMLRFTIEKKGEHSVKIRVFDKYKYYTSKDATLVKIEKTPSSTANITIDGENLNKSSENKIVRFIASKDSIINIQATDNASGIKSLKYCCNFSGIKDIRLSPWKDSNVKISNDGHSANVSIPVISDISATWCVCVEITNNAGNTTYVRSDVYMTYLPPQIRKCIGHYKSKKCDTNIHMSLNRDAIANVFNKTTNQALTEKTHYTVEKDKIILRQEYLNTLSEGKYELEISFYPAGQTNLAEGLTLPKDTTTLFVTEFNNLKKEYTYGDEPGIISLNGGSESDTVTYESSNESVAQIDKKTGELIIVGAGTFRVKATLNSVTFTSDPIEVHPNEVLLKKKTKCH